MKKLKYGVAVNELEEKFYEIILYLDDITRNESFFIKWANSKDRTTGTNISEMEKLPNGMIEIAFPIFYDDDIDPNPYIISKERFIKFLKDWQDFGKSGKEYIYLNRTSASS